MAGEIEMKIKHFLYGSLLLGAFAANAEIKLADPFSDHMVLQRNRPIPVWGKGTPGEHVTVTLNGESVSAVTDENGKWRADLPAMSHGGPYTLTATASNEETISDVLIGDVWLISGQSNADMTVKASGGGEAELASANNPMLRLHEVYRTKAESPLTDMVFRTCWGTVTPGSFPNFSAVGYYFGKKMQEVTGIPIGIIGSHLGGSSIEMWLEETPGETLYNAMICPFAPNQLAGIIWYQGEANMLGGWAYAPKLRSLASTWRRIFENPEMPFVVIELAPYNYPLGHPTMLPEFWEVQRAVAAEDDNMITVPINDLGDPADIHPARKREVGERAALMVLGEITVPQLEDISRDGSTLLLTFSNGDGLNGPDSGFEVAGLDNVYHKANAAAIGNGQIVVSAPEVAFPVAVRYDWTQSATGEWHNSDGVPLPSFSRSAGLTMTEISMELVPEAGEFETLYELDLLDLNLAENMQDAVYAVDNSALFDGKTPVRTAYFLYFVTVTGEVQWVWASVDPLSTDVKKLGLPTAASGVEFQGRLSNLFTASNMPNVETGSFPSAILEFHPWDVAPAATGTVQGASSDLFDADDTVVNRGNPGYGVMQLFNGISGKVVFAYNHFRLHQPGVTISCDLGIGTAPAGWQPDWSQCKNWKQFQSAKMLIMAKF